ncbi:class I SAM-dependent methyltransferase [Imbroritus primus]|uniref:class I SAM-dependent methyltransferase n=1 Tax=Imbroritus primus TaxID=3058603 RepID=UPI003D161D6E
MNLFDMANRQDDALYLQPQVKMAKWVAKNGDTWRSLRLREDVEPQVVVKDVIQWYPFSMRPETVGWYARTLGGEAKLRVTLRHRQQIIATNLQDIDPRPVDVIIPWPLCADPLPPEVSLTLEFLLLQGQVADLMINKALDRTQLISLAKGVGIEIGPGPKPQILNGPGVSVRYLEEMSAAEWNTLYDESGKYNSGNADWSQYIVGPANEIPVPDGSLDFIFSSHVFEHLANPIGHLEHWGRKLKSKGVILAVVPDIAGTKDFRHSPCLLDEMLTEYQNEIWRPTLTHYQRWANTRGGWSARAEEAMLARRSIHVHFYTRENMARLLAYATEQLKYSGYHICHTPNHRDFYWILIKE